MYTMEVEMTYHVRLMVKVISLLLIAVDVILIYSLPYDCTIENLCVWEGVGR